MAPLVFSYMFTMLLGFLPIFWLQNISANVMIVDTTMSRMVELNVDAPFCVIYNDSGIIQKMIFDVHLRKIHQMSSNLVNDLIQTCKASYDARKNRIPGNGLIYPGTKWCGLGNAADSYNDLGQHSAEDLCCREHDHCPYTIAPQQCTNGICNNLPFTRSHCDCDVKFRRCLQNLNTEVANALSTLFFNVIQASCFKERQPCFKWQNCELQWENSSNYLSNNFLKKRRFRKSLLKIFFIILNLKRRKNLFQDLALLRSTNFNV